MTIVQSASPLPLYNKLSLNTSFLQAYFQRSTPFHITLAHYMNSQNLYSTRVYKGYHCDSKGRSQSNAFYVPSKCEFESHLHFATISLKSVDIEYRFSFSKEPKFQAFFSNMTIHLVCGKKDKNSRLFTKGGDSYSTKFYSPFEMYIFKIVACKLVIINLEYLDLK